jgi:hypothetical protein
MEFSMPNKEVFAAQPCTIETIDTGFVEHLEKEFNIHVFTNSGFKKVPVIWVGSERAFQVKANSSLRDTSGKLILPIITVERTSLQKDKTFKGGIQAHFGPNNQKGREYLGGTYKLVSKFNQIKTSQRRLAKNLRESGEAQIFSEGYDSEMVFDEYLIPLPTYVSVTYTVTLRCEYQQQMNQMVLPFITKTGQINHFVFTKDNHRFESFIQQDYAASNNLSNMSEEERKFQTKIEIKVLGYVIGEGDNETRPKIVKRETIAKLSPATETVITIADRLPRTASTTKGTRNLITEPEKTVEEDPKCLTIRKLRTLPLEEIVAARSKLIKSGLPFQAVNDDFSPRDITDIIDGVIKSEETLFNERDIALEVGEDERRVTIIDGAISDEPCDEE